MNINYINPTGQRTFRSKVVGSPTSGTWKANDLVTDPNCTVHRCVLGGSPGTWEHSQVVVDQTVSLAGAGAKFVAGPTIPAGAVIKSVQANIEVLAVGGGTTVKIGLGPNATATNKYGNTSALTKNAKITTTPDFAVLTAAETIDVCGVVAAGNALGDTNVSAGSVRVRVVYVLPTALNNA